MLNYLICLAGLPASGKSTFARKYKEILEQKFENESVKIIDLDLIRNSLVPGDFNYKKEKRVRKKNLKLIQKALTKGDIVISDDLNYFSSMRHEILEIADKSKSNCYIIHISTPLEVCLKWNEKRGGNIPEEVIKNISQKFDNFNRYAWDKPLAKIDLSKISNLSQKVEDIMEIIRSDVNKAKISLKTVKESIKHSNANNERLEKITRKFVGQLFRNPKYLQNKERILEIRRQFVMENLNKSLSKSKISRTFKSYLEKHLDVSIS